MILLALRPANEEVLFALPYRRQGFSPQYDWYVLFHKDDYLCYAAWGVVAVVARRRNHDGGSEAVEGDSAWPTCSPMTRMANSMRLLTPSFR